MEIVKEITNNEIKTNYLFESYTLEDAEKYLKEPRSKAEWEDGQHEEKDKNIDWVVPLTNPVICNFQ